jgi:hypothetical protein
MEDTRDSLTIDLPTRRRAWWRIVAYGAMLLLSLLALTGIAAAG